jgi:cytochrome c biogenesis protein CcdA
MGWWLWSARGEDLAATWTLFSAYNIGSVLIQWAVVLAVLLALNRWLARSAGEADPGAGAEPTRS